MFQSAPVIADGRTHRDKGISGALLAFQSAPVIADGRTLECEALGIGLVCVSIRARHR